MYDSAIYGIHMYPHALCVPIQETLTSASRSILKVGINVVILLDR